MNLNALQKNFFKVCKRQGLVRNKVWLLIDYKYDEKQGVQLKSIQMPLFNLKVLSDFFKIFYFHQHLFIFTTGFCIRLELH